MKQTCKYDPMRDILEVVEGLSVNLDKALTSGVIRDTSVPAQYNMQKELAEVGNRVSEPFDVIEYERAYTRIRKQIKDKKDEEKE